MTKSTAESHPLSRDIEPAFDIYRVDAAEAFVDGVEGDARAVRVPAGVEVAAVLEGDRVVDGLRFQPGQLAA